MNDSADGEWTREEYPVGFRVTLSMILLLEEAGGLICNVLVLLVFHIRKKKIVNNGSSGGGSNSTCSLCFGRRHSFFSIFYQHFMVPTSSASVDHIVLARASVDGIKIANKVNTTPPHPEIWD